MEKWVKIIDAKLPTYWYGSMIGKIFKVEDSHLEGEWLAIEGEWPDDLNGWVCLIDKEDTIVINKEDKYNGERIKHKFL